jgi:RHS repeat-associated protein
VEENIFGDLGKTTDYYYNPLNQLIYTEDSYESRQDYSYDSRGNLLEIYSNKQLTHQYHFNAHNQLEKVFNYEKQLGASYNYNGFGNRISKIEGEAIEQVTPSLLGTNIKSLEDIRLNPTKEIDDVLDLTKEYNNLLQRRQDQDVTSYIWDINVLSLQVGEGNYQNCFHDELGSTLRILDDTGSETGLYGYDEFGNELLPETASHRAQQPFKYAGYQSCTITSNLYAQAREYSPSKGRFISHDKYWNQENRIYGDDNVYSEVPNQLIHLLPDSLAISQSNNPYSYTVNSPLRYTDPTGLTCECVMIEDSYGLDWNKIIAGLTDKAFTEGMKSIEKDLQRTLTALVDDVISVPPGARYNKFVKNAGRIRTGVGGAFMVIGGISYFNSIMEDKDMTTQRAIVQTGGYVATTGYLAASGAIMAGAVGLFLFGPVGAIVFAIIGGTASSVGGSVLYEYMINNINPNPFGDDLYEILDWHNKHRVDQ